MTAWLAAFQVGSTASTTASTTARRIAYLPDEHTDFIFSVSPDGLSIARLAVVAVLLVAIVFLLRRRRSRGRSAVE